MTNDEMKEFLAKVQEITGAEKVRYWDAPSDVPRSIKIRVMWVVGGTQYGYERIITSHDLEYIGSVKNYMWGRIIEEIRRMVEKGQQ